ncbi:MAG: Hcp family type VI secretion system effector [Saccharospirillaceae bacterium]|nr:Hcp family type VI secretion system effector [Pseudomonadales bacterium]NRB81683.1 Hcp family type VI secretion system effector [Saccharospirillaceae bacterium]
MAIPCGLTIIGENQGEIEGACEIPSREGSMLVYAVDHCVELPTDNRGVSSGRRLHRPLTITKEIDKASPMILQALCTGERLSEVSLDYYRIDEIGSEELYYKVILSNALVSKVKPWMPNSLDATKSGYRHMEDVSFIYEKIRWTWELDGIEFEDVWGESSE